MSKNDKMTQEIEALQLSESHVILNNPLASPKFIKAISKSKDEALSTRDIYTPKMFYEIVSRLKPSDLDLVRKSDGTIDDSKSIPITINIKKFAESIGAIKNHDFYKDIRNTADYLSSIKIVFKDIQGRPTSVGIVNNKTKTDLKGGLMVYVDGELAELILNVKEKGNFSFLKEYIFGLENGQAIKLYPFFKSWVNLGKYETYSKGDKTGLETFKEDFGYNTSGYKRFALFEKYVLKPAIEEINKKTDIVVSYELVGDNLEGKRPRVTGLIFWINFKENIKMLPTGQAHKKVSQSQPVAEKESTIEQVKRDNGELYDLFKKIPVKQKTDEITAHVLVDSWVASLGFDVVKDGFLGMIATKAQPETVAFFTAENLKKYIGYAKKHEEQELKKKELQEKQRKEQELERLAKDLERKYNEDKNTHYRKKYNELSEVARIEYLRDLFDSTEIKGIYFKNGDISQPNSYAIEKIGEMITFPDGYDHEEIFKSYVFKTFGYQVYFENGKMKLS